MRLPHKRRSLNRNTLKRKAYTHMPIKELNKETKRSVGLKKTLSLIDDGAEILRKLTNKKYDDKI